MIEGHIEFFKLKALDLKEVLKVIEELPNLEYLLKSLPLKVNFFR